MLRTSQALLLPKQPVVLMSYNLKNERRGFLDHMKALNNAGFGVGGYACQRIYELAPEGRLPDPSLAPEDIPFWLLGLQVCTSVARASPAAVLGSQTRPTPRCRSAGVSEASGHRARK